MKDNENWRTTNTTYAQATIGFEWKPSRRSRKGFLITRQIVESATDEFFKLGSRIDYLEAPDVGDQPLNPACNEKGLRYGN